MNSRGHRCESDCAAIAAAWRRQCGAVWRPDVRADGAGFLPSPVAAQSTRRRGAGWSPIDRPAAAGWRRCCFWPASRCRCESWPNWPILPTPPRPARCWQSCGGCYDERGCAFQVEQLAGGYQLRTRPKFAPWLRPLVPRERANSAFPAGPGDAGGGGLSATGAAGRGGGDSGRGLRGNSSAVDGPRPLAYRGTFGRIRAAAVVRNHEAISGSVWAV